MNNEKVIEIEEAIRELKCLLSLNDLAPRTPHNSLLNKNLDKRKQAISQSILWGKSLALAESELPEKKEIDMDSPMMECKDRKRCEGLGFNQTLDLIKPRWAKKILEITTIKAKMKKFESGNVNLRGIRDRWMNLYLELKDRYKQLQQELSTLKAKIEKLEDEGKELKNGN